MFNKARVLWWIGLLCLVPFFFPVLQHSQIPNGTDTRFTLGLPLSPWLSIAWTDTERRIENGMSSSFTSNHSHSFNVELICWSSLFALTGIVLMMVSRRMKAERAPPT